MLRRQKFLEVALRGRRVPPSYFQLEMFRGTTLKCLCPYPRASAARTTSKCEGRAVVKGVEGVDELGKGPVGAGRGKEGGGASARRGKENEDAGGKEKKEVKRFEG